MTNYPKGFTTTGCWVRVVCRPYEEAQTLGRRDPLDKKDLMGHDHPKSPGYTRYSCCTYVRKGLPVSLFDKIDSLHPFALVMKPFTRKIDWFYNGRKGAVSDDAPIIPGKLFNNGERDSDQRWHCPIDEVEKAVIALYEEFKWDSYYRRHPDESPTLSWNEGFIRHQRGDITGMIINPTCRESVVQALAMRSALRISIRFYTYDEKLGDFKEVNVEALRSKFKIGTLSRSLEAATQKFRELFTGARSKTDNELRLQHTAKSTVPA